MTAPQTERRKTRRGQRGGRGRGKGAKLGIAPYSEAATTEKVLGRSKTLTPLGDYSWVSASLGRDIAEAINTDQVTMQHRRLILEHPQMSAGMLIFAAFLASNRWEIKCDAPEVKAFAEALLRPIWRPLIRSMLKGVAFGYVPFERRYKNVTNLKLVDEASGREFKLPSALMYHGLKALPPDSVELWLDRDRYAGFAQRRFNIPRLEPEETFWYAHNMDAGQLHGCPRLNTGTRDFWVYNVVCWQHLMRYGARIASPPLVGYAPDGYRRKVDPDSNDRTVWQPIQTLHAAARGLQESGVLIMPTEETPSGKQRFSIGYLTDSSPSVPRLISMITESGHQMLYSWLLPPQMFESLTPGRGQGYGSVASLGGLAAEGVDDMMADMADWIENGNPLYDVPGLLQEPIRATFGPGMPHAYLVPNKTSRNRLAMLAELLGVGIRSGRASANFDAMADELGVAGENDLELDYASNGGVRARGRVPAGREDDPGPEPQGRVQTPEMG